MDAKERARLQSFHDKLDALTFDENVVALLLMALRPDARPGQPVYEFANFIAHRTRNRGVIFTHLDRLSTDPFFFAAQAAPIKPVFTEREVHDSLNVEFARHGFPFITTAASAAVLLCIMSLLQRAVMEDRRGNQFAQLVITFSNRDVALLGEFTLLRDHSLLEELGGVEVVTLAFPVLFLENVFVGLESDFSIIPSEDSCIEIQYENGQPKVAGLEKLRYSKFGFTYDPKTGMRKAYEYGQLIEKRPTVRKDNSGE